MIPISRLFCSPEGVIPFKIVSRVEGSAHAPRLPRFVLLGSFSDSLLVVLILDIVYDCYL